MSVADELLHTLRTWHRTPAGQLVRRLNVSRATLKRAVDALGPAVVALGQARRRAYAARRALRGSMQALPLFEVDEHGRLHEVAMLSPLHPAGCAVEAARTLAWPLDEDMRDGWFDGLPYFLDDMRPQGFLGRNFARHHAALLQVSEHPQDWSENDVLYALSLLGLDQSGSYILGETACRQWLEQSRHEPVAVTDEDVGARYAALAAQAMALGVEGSSAGGEFPKFTAIRRDGAGQWRHVIVKFSGNDDSPGTQRWADLLVCEHLALEVVSRHLRAGAAGSRIHREARRTFLEVDRFDRHGRLGRSPLCSWAAVNAALFGTNGLAWTGASAAMHSARLVDADTRTAIDELWHFGKLIANADMHDGNLSFRPGLRLAPAYDMLPMLYAPVRGVELPPRHFSPPLPLPAERTAWEPAARAAIEFWSTGACEQRISDGFRRICEENHRQLQALIAQ